LLANTHWELAKLCTLWTILSQRFPQLQKGKENNQKYTCVEPGLSREGFPPEASGGPGFGALNRPIAIC
jgi:hypothetical protein